MTTTPTPPAPTSPMPSSPMPSSPMPGTPAGGLHDPSTPGSSAENPDAGQGPVLLDIGGDVGALIVRMPADSVGLEGEIRPSGATPDGSRVHSHDGGGHAHTHDDVSHAHHHESVAGPGHHPHVAVVLRRTGTGVIPCLVYPQVPAGTYRLHPLPAQEPSLAVEVVGGTVTETVWPVTGHRRAPSAAALSAAR